MVAMIKIFECVQKRGGGGDSYKTTDVRHKPMFSPLKTGNGGSGGPEING